MAQRPEKILCLPGADTVLAVEGDIGTVESAEWRLEGAAAGEQLPLAVLIRVTGNATRSTQHVGAALAQLREVSANLRRCRRRCPPEK